MRIKSFEELASPDDLTLRFAPLGLALGGALTPADAADFQQHAIASCDLADNVADGTRQSFERLRELHSYGVLFYDAFTVAGDLTSTVAELALRERFVEFYGAEIPLRKRGTGELSPLPASNYGEVDRAFRTGGSHRKGNWGLPIDGAEDFEFRGSMTDLLAWARAVGLLPGQRSRPRDALLVDIRNSVAHPQFHRYGPVESAMSIRDLAELINQLWGHPTDGGRHFPAPREREAFVIAWSSRQVAIIRPQHLADLEDPDDWKCIVIQAVADDPHIWDFDSEVERTHYPADLLAGPAPVAQTLVWIGTADLEIDVIGHLDRIFVTQIDGTSVAGPWRPEVALNLSAAEHGRRWLLLRADHPSDAYAYTRWAATCADWSDVEKDITGSAPEGQTSVVTPLAAFDDWGAMTTRLADDFGISGGRRPESVRVPSMWELGPGGP
ncbi:MAG: hypothetical protein NVSMB48_10730 [Marmoricola sp.]